MLKGLATTARTLARPTHTAEYPDAQPDLPPRSRGVIALLEENCTPACSCARECPDWCIYIDSHKETIPATTEGGRERQRNVLDRFAIDFSLCMYCGICIEVCPFDALHWSPEFEYAEIDIRDLLHEKDRLGQWMPTVPPPPALDARAAEPAEIAAADRPAARGRPGDDRAPARQPPPTRRPTPGAPAPTSGRPGNDGLDVAFAASASSPRPAAARGDDPARGPRRPVAGGRLGAVAGCYLRARRRVRGPGAAAGLRRRDRRAGALRPDADPRADRAATARSAPAGCTGSLGGRRSVPASPPCSPRLLLPLGGRAVERRDDRHPGSRQQLFGTWVWPFEILSLLLLVALIAAIAR